MLSPETEEDGYPPASLLVVDDSAANRLAMTALLEPLGHRLVEARSGREALERARAEEFAVILLDVNMPGLDGFETINVLRKERLAARTPVILLSAVYDGMHHARRAFALGAVDYLAKPFDPDLLRDKVGALASLYRRGKELQRRAAIIERAEGEISAARLAVSHAEDERRRSEREGRSKDRYIGILGHDLRNPLNVISMTAQALAGAEDLPPRHLRSAQRILRSTERMTAMIRDLLDFTRGQLGGGIPINRAPADAARLAETAADEIRVLHPTRQLQVVITGDLHGSWDGERLRQVVSNLLGNAVQHGADPVVLTATGEETDVVLEVHSHGEPIPEEELSSLFEPFRRGDGERPDGLGLGLYIVKEIVAAHRGTIEARSTAADGTRFVCRLPRS